jgi:rRNA-processing protein FCF1
VTIEIVSWRDLDLSRVPRPPLDPDDDILDVCEALRVYANTNACFVATTDTGMKLKSKERDLRVAYLGSDLHVGLTEDDPSDQS